MTASLPTNNEVASGSQSLSFFNGAIKYFKIESLKMTWKQSAIKALTGNNIFNWSIAESCW